MPSESAVSPGDGRVLAHNSAQRQQRKRRRRQSETLIYWVLVACGLVSIFTTFGIIYSLFIETVRFFGHVSIWEFLTGTEWAPLFEPQHFGVLPLVNGTLMVAAGAMLVALPVGLASAVYLSEYAAEGLRKVLKPLLEILSGVPTVVYGYFALTFITPLLQKALPETNVFNAASAALVVGIMVIPMVASLSEDAMLAVPRSLREAAYALGATRLEVAMKVVIPAAMSGIASAFLLAISRAIGETMIVALAAGSTARMGLNFLDSIETMTAYIVRVSHGDTPHGSIEYQTIYAVGMLLFLMTLVMNLLAQRVARRWRREVQ